MDYFTRFSRDIARAFSPELPKGLGNMDENLDFILPKVRPYGEDLRENGFWLAKRWKEVRDEEGFHESILHIFNTGGEYLISLDGNIIKGTWRQLGAENTLIIEMAGKSELFDLQFLNPEFMVLSKHGDQARKGLRRFFMLTYEPATHAGGRELVWHDLVERLYNVWRENSLSLWAWLAFIILIALFLYYSVK